MPESPEIVTVTQAELHRALAIWISTAPKRIWRDYWNVAETERKWLAGHEPLNRFDPRHAMGEYLAEKFRLAGWTVSHPKILPRVDLTKPARSDREAP